MITLPYRLTSPAAYLRRRCMLRALAVLIAISWIACMLVTAALAQRFPGVCCGEYDCLLKPVPRAELERRE